MITVHNDNLFLLPDVNTSLYAVRILWKSYWCNQVLCKNNSRDAHIWNTGELDLQEAHITTVPGTKWQKWYADVYVLNVAKLS